MRQDTTFQPSYSLNKLLQNSDQELQDKQKLAFKLNNQYERLPVQRATSAEPKTQQEQQMRDLDALFTFGGTKEVKILDQIKNTTLGKHNTDTYRRYKQYLETEQDKIKEDKQAIVQRPVVVDEQQMQIEVELEDSIEAEVGFNLEGYERLMKPAQLRKQDVQDLSFMEALLQGQTVLLQLPSLIPFEQIIQTSHHQQQFKAKNIDDQAELMKEYYLSNLTDAAGFPLKKSYQQIVSRDKLKIPANEDILGIRLGKIVMDPSSGGATWHVGEEEYAINRGIQSSSLQELVALDGDNSTMHQFGALGMKFVATPNVESLIS